MTRTSPASQLAARPTRRTSLPAEVADQLLELVAAADAPELALPAERQLGEQLGVSRNVLREALAMLDGLRVLEVRGKTRVASVPRARAQLVARIPADTAERELASDPIEVRRMLEPEAAALAATRGTPAAIAEIARALTRMEAAVAHGRPAIEHDAAFHVAVARATGNHTLMQLVDAFTDALRTSRERSFDAPGAAGSALDDHRAILAAIEARDAAGARRAMRAHLDRVERLIRQALAADAS